MSSDPIDPVPFEPYPSEPAAKTPPATVTYAAWSQYAILALAVISTVLTIVSTLDVVGQMRDALSSTDTLNQGELETMLSLVQVISIGAAVVTLLFSVAVGVLGHFNLKGRNGARVATWVLAGVGLACGVCSGAAAPFNSTVNTATSGDELTNSVNDALSTIQIPAWQNTVSILLLVVSTILYLVVIVLLAMPASNDYFRKDPSAGLPSHFG